MESRCPLNFVSTKSIQMPLILPSLVSDLIVKFYFTIRERYTCINITVYNGNVRVISESRCSTCVFVVDVHYNGIERYLLIFPYIYHCYFVLIHCWEVGAEGGWPPFRYKQATEDTVRVQVRTCTGTGIPVLIRVRTRVQYKYLHGIR